MHHDDIEAVADIHAEQFHRQNNSSVWVQCNFAAFPRIMLFVARSEQDEVVGYIQWIQKSGFRKEAVFELEQIAVLQSYQSAGIGTKLIKESLQAIKNYLADSNSILKAILITTRSDNKAQHLYTKVLEAEVAAVIKNLYSYDEVVMIARGI